MVQEITSKSKKIQKSIEKMQEEIYTLKADLKTNQDILKHKWLKFAGTPDKEQEWQMVNLMKELVET